MSKSIICGLLGSLLIIVGCSHSSQPQPDTTPSATVTETADDTAYRPFPGDSLHDLLVAEVAVQRKEFSLALKLYLKQARETRDIAVIARTTRLAQYINAEPIALEAAKLWLEIDPNSVEAHYTCATMHSKNAQFLTALQHMEKVLVLGGNTNFNAIAGSALKASALKRKVLLDELQKLSRKHPNNSQLYTAQALLQQSLEDPETALASSQLAIQHDAKNLQAIAIESRLLQELGRNEEALRKLQIALKEFPRNIRLRLQLARLLLNSDLTAAAEQFELLLAEQPDNPDFLLSVALIYIEIKDLANAKEYFQQLLATGQRGDQAHFYLAKIAEHEGDKATAIQHLAAISQGSDYIAATNQIAEIYASNNQLPDARAVFQQRRNENPTIALPLYLLEAELLFKLKEYKESHQLLSMALKNHPQQTNLLYMRSMVSEKRNDFTLMEADLRNIIALKPDNAMALNALGYVLANRNQQLEEAFNLITRALTIKPGDPAILDSLGWVEYRRGNLVKAEQLLQQAYQNFPDPEVAAHLGEVLWQLGKFNEAKAIWRKAQQKHPKHPVLIDTMQRFQEESALSTSQLPAS